MQRSIDTRLFAWPSSDPHLLGSECNDCGTVSFPRQSSCPKCCGASIQERGLATEGTLWTWTTQEFAPKSPPYAVSRKSNEFSRFLLGYIELPGEIMVESRIAAEYGSLAIGMPMQLKFSPLFVDEQGVEVISYAFAPMETA